MFLTWASLAGAKDWDVFLRIGKLLAAVQREVRSGGGQVKIGKREIVGSNPTIIILSFLIFYQICLDGRY